MIYTTKQNDTFDLVSYKVFGECRYTPEICAANPEYLRTFVFPAGIKLTIPDIETTTTTASTTLPGWF